MTITPQKLLNQIRNPIVIYNDFLINFNPSSHIIYYIVEGKEDSLFYDKAIDDKKPDNWDKHLFPAGDKDKVLYLKSLIDKKMVKRCFVKNQILYFIDRDLSEPLGKSLPNDENLYITDGYSIENSVYNSSTLINVLVQLYNCQKLNIKQKKYLIACYDLAYKKFSSILLPIMAFLLFSLENNIQFGIKRLKINNIFDFEFKNGKIVFSTLKTRNEIYNKIKTEGNVNENQLKKFKKRIYINKFKEYNFNNNLIRGKFVELFFISFCEYFFKLCENGLFPLSGKPKRQTTIPNEGAMVAIAPRAKIPRSLNDFLETNFSKLI